METYTHSELAAIESSFVIAHQFAKSKNPYSFREELIKPCFSKVARSMLGAPAAAKIDKIPLSRRTITRRSTEMALDVLEQLCDRLKRSGNFALQIVDSTNVAGNTILRKASRIFSAAG